MPSAGNRAEHFEPARYHQYVSLQLSSKALVAVRVCVIPVMQLLWTRAAAKHIMRLQSVGVDCGFPFMLTKAWGSVEAVLLNPTFCNVAFCIYSGRMLVLNYFVFFWAHKKYFIQPSIGWIGSQAVLQCQAFPQCQHIWRLSDRAS